MNFVINKKYVFIIFVFLFFKGVSQVNLVPNFSFEQGCDICCFQEADFGECCSVSYITNTSDPLSLDYVALIDPYIFWADCNNLPEYDKINEKYFFCPDEWEIDKVSSKTVPLYFKGQSGCYLGVPDNHYGTRMAYEGTAYIGLMSGSKTNIINNGNQNSGVRIALTEATEKCNRYTIKLYASQAANVQKDFSKLKISLENETHKEKVHKGLIRVDDTVNWEEIEFEFVDEKNRGYTHLVIETTFRHFAKEALVYIDNVTVTKECGGNCSNTVGCIEPIQAGSPINTTTPFCLINLDNVTFARLQIYSSSAGKVIDINRTNPNGVGTICWDGTINGAIAPNAVYTYRLTAENDCISYDSEDDSSLNLRVDTFLTALPAPPVDNSSHGNWSKTPIPCCKDVIVIENTTLIGDLVYQAGRKIIVGPNVTIPNGTTVKFIAEEEVEFIGNVIKETGAEVHSYLEMCPEMRLAQSEEEISSALEEQNIDNMEDHIIKESFYAIVSPNPTEDVFYVKLHGHKARLTKIKLYDILGNIIKQKTQSSSQSTVKFDITNLNSGMYFLQVENGEEVDSKKIIKK